MELAKQGKEIAEQVKAVFHLAKRPEQKPLFLENVPKHSGGELQPVIEMVWNPQVPIQEMAVPSGQRQNGSTLIYPTGSHPSTSRLATGWKQSSALSNLLLTAPLYQNTYCNEFTKVQNLGLWSE